MILTSHILAGAAIASKSSNPFLTLPLAFLSHYLLDSLPQEEYSIINIKKKLWNKAWIDFLMIFADISFGILLILLSSNNSPLIFAGAFSALVPDGITLLQILNPQNKLINRHQKIHMKIQRTVDHLFYSKNKKAPVFWGIFSQIAIVITAIFLMR